MPEPLTLHFGFSVGGDAYHEVGTIELDDPTQYRAKAIEALRAVADEYEAQERAEQTAADPDAALAAIQRMWNGGPAVNDDD